MMDKPKQYLMYSAENISAVATYKRDVVLEVKLPDAGLMPGVTVAFRIEPQHARALASLLLLKAAEAEAL